MRYPSHWTPDFETQAFQHGDLINLSFFTFSDEQFQGGGGFKGRSASITIAKPRKTIKPSITLDFWVEDNVMYGFKKIRKDIQPNTNLVLAGEKAYGIYDCGGSGCTNQLYTLKNGRIFAVLYGVREDFEAADERNFRSDLCGILTTIKIE